MIRWSYVIPRLVVVLALILVAKYAVPWGLRWSAIRSLRATTGAVAEVDHVWTSPLHGRIRLEGVRLAQRARSTSNMIEYKSADLAINLAALTRRQFVIDQAEIRGIAFNTARCPEAETMTPEPLAEPRSGHWSTLGAELGRQWWRSVSSALQTRVEDQFASVQVVREMAERWPRTYDQLERDITRCQRQAQLFHDRLARMPAVLRNGGRLDSIRDLRNEGEALQVQISQTHDRVLQARDQLLQDRLAVQKVLAQDRATLRSALHVTELNRDELSTSLLTGEVHAWIDQVRPWLDVAAWLMTKPKAVSAEARGTLIGMNDDATPDGFLLKRVAMDGTVDFRGRRLPFIGQAHNLATELSQPVVFSFQVGNAPFTEVTVALQPSASGPRQSVMIIARGIATPPQTWGSTDGLALSIGPASADVRLALVRHGDTVDGDVQLTVNDVCLVPVVKGDGTQPLQSQLKNALADLDSFAASAIIHGTQDNPTCQIKSTVGAQLEQRIRGVLARVLDAQAEHLQQQANQQINAQLAAIEKDATRRQQELLGQLEVGRKLVSSIADPAQVSRSNWSKLLHR